jgi:hypothetical protein
MLGGFGKTRGVNRSSLFSDGMSKGVSKLSEIGNTPDSEIKRSSTGKHTVETDAKGRTIDTKTQTQQKIDTTYTIAGRTGSSWVGEEKTFEKGDTMGITILYGEGGFVGYDSIRHVKY